MGARDCAGQPYSCSLGGAWAGIPLLLLLSPAPAGGRGWRLQHARAGEEGREDRAGGRVLRSGSRSCSEEFGPGFARDVGGLSPAGPSPKAGRGSRRSLDGREEGTEGTAAWGLGISGALGCSCPRF